MLPTLANFAQASIDAQERLARLVIDRRLRFAQTAKVRRELPRILGRRSDSAPAQRRHPV